MKTFLVLILFCSSAIAAPSTSKQAKPAGKTETTVKNEGKLKEHNTLDKKPTEDCDEKAKKPIEVTQETFSLSGGATGCTLDEAHP